MAGELSDLNPIENIWFWMKMKLRDSSAKNMEDWKRGITELWCLKLSDNEYLQKLVASMPKRLAKVIKKEGWTTHY
jgi:hypothetical protein